MVHVSKTSGRYGLAAALALALLQVIVVSHALTGDHALDERCEVCLVAERSDDDGSPSTSPAGIPPAGSPDDAVAPVLRLDDPTQTPSRARGPPTL